MSGHLWEPAWLASGKISRNTSQLLRYRVVHESEVGQPVWVNYYFGAANTYNVSVTESGSAADTLSVNNVLHLSLSDSGSATDALATVATLNPSLSESGSALDVLSVTGGSSGATQVTEVPAGRSRRRRLFVEIDGEAFWVSSEDEARRILIQARETAKALAEVSVKRARLSGEPVRTPVIRGSKAIAAQVAEAKLEIDEIFRVSEIDYELYALLNERIRQEDEEEVLMLL